VTVLHFSPALMDRDGHPQDDRTSPEPVVALHQQVQNFDPDRGRPDRLPPGTAVHLAGGPVQRQSSPPPLLPTDPPWSFPDRRPRRTAPWTATPRTRSVRAPWRMTCSAAGVELDPLQGPTQLHNARPLQLYEHTDLERCLTTPDNGRRDALHPDDDGGGV
jgi:hypothetical protein